MLPRAGDKLRLMWEAVSQLIGALDTLLPPSLSTVASLRCGRRDHTASCCARAICDGVTMTRVFALRTFLWIFVCVDSISGQGKGSSSVYIFIVELNYCFFTVHFTPQDYSLSININSKNNILK